MSWIVNTLILALLGVIIVLYDTLRDSNRQASRNLNFLIDRGLFLEYVAFLEEEMEKKSRLTKWSKKNWR